MPWTADEFQVQLGTIKAAFEEAHPFATTTITLDGHPLSVLVAETREQKAQGMIGRRFEHDGSEGMLFVEPTESYAAFHSTGVLEDLVVAFFDTNGNWQETLELLPHEPGFAVRPQLPFKFALELPSAHSATLKLNKGSRLSM